MRKIFAIIALVCLLFFTAGYRLLYRIRLAEVKKEMKAEILSQNNEAATKLVFAQSQLKNLVWEDSSEFTYEGEKYDVIRMQKEGDKTIIWCIADEKETALINNYLKLHKQSPEKSTSNSLLKFLSDQFNSTAFIELSPEVKDHSKTFPLYTFTLSFMERTILIPPPKFC